MSNTFAEDNSKTHFWIKDALGATFIRLTVNRVKPPLFDPPATWAPQFAEMAVDLGLAEIELASATLVLRILVRDAEDARRAE